MKKAFLILVMLSSFFGFSQKVALTREQAQKKVYEYVLERLDSFHRDTKLEAVCVKLFFKDNFKLDKVSYYLFNRELSGEYDEQPEVEVPPYLDVIIKQYFGFNKQDFFPSRKGGIESYAFAIPFSSKDLNDAITYKNILPPPKNSSYNINADSRFHLKINELSIAGKQTASQTIKSRLITLNSEAIQVGAFPTTDIYFVFRVINTSKFWGQKEWPLTFLEYKLFYKEGSRMYQVAYSRADIENGKVNISEQEVFGSKDVLDDYYCARTNENGDEVYDTVDLQGLKFNFDVEFE